MTVDERNDLTHCEQVSILRMALFGDDVEQILENLKMISTASSEAQRVHYTRQRRGFCETYEALDIRELHRENRLGPGQRFEWSWVRGEEQGAIIAIRTEPSAIVLNYEICVEGDEWTTVEERVPIVWTACHLGGARPWFSCPGIDNRRCGRRVALLFGVEAIFGCRHCYNLAYSTQHQNARLRAISKAQKMRARLGASPNVYAALPGRPKHKHRRTYRRLRRRAQRCDAKAIEAMQPRSAPPRI